MKEDAGVSVDAIRDAIEATEQIYGQAAAVANALHGFAKTIIEDLLDVIGEARGELTDLLEELLLEGREKEL